MSSLPAWHAGHRGRPWAPSSAARCHGPCFATRALPRVQVGHPALARHQHADMQSSGRQEGPAPFHTGTALGRKAKASAGAATATDENARAQGPSPGKRGASRRPGLSTVRTGTAALCKSRVADAALCHPRPMRGTMSSSETSEPECGLAPWQRRGPPDSLPDPAAPRSWLYAAPLGRRGLAPGRGVCRLAQPSRVCSGLADVGDAPPARTGGGVVQSTSGRRVPTVRSGTPR